MKGKELFYIVISSFILTVLWISSNVYHSYVTSTIDPLLRIQTLPIDPDFDASTIQRLKSRQKIVPISEATPLLPETSPTTTPQQELSPTVEVLPSPSPTDVLLIPSISPTP